MCVDELVAQGMRLADLAPATRASMQRWAPPEASLRNPIDLTPQASLDDYRLALEGVLADEGVDAVVAIYVPPVRPDELEVARAVWQTAKGHRKPVVCNFLGRAEDSPGFVELVGHGVPSYLFPESAARSLAAMYRYAQYRQREEGEARIFRVDRSAAEKILSRARADDRAQIRGDDANALLELYGIRAAKTRFVPRIEGLAKAAASIGYPVVLKATGPEIVHKSDLGAVLVGVRDEKELVDGATQISHRLRDNKIALDGFLVQEFVEGGKEVVVGMTRDKVYGPLIAFGLGGIYVEYLKDVALGVPPLTDRDAMRMIESIRTFPILQGVRGEGPRDLEALQDAILRVAQLVSDFPSIEGLDLNPVFALPRGRGYRAVDARILLARDA
ncbi:MAG: acetate--CoA ligase family protein [Methanobacteriota archaeon]|nr:MAG: acetate--CoA ligase family protein [Euryarchaeota archaeon]